MLFCAMLSGFIQHRLGEDILMGLLSSKFGKVIVVFAFVVVSVGSLWLWQRWLDPDAYPIRVVKVEGQFVHASRDKIQQSLLPLIGHGFFALDLEAIRDQLLAMPWVKHAAVRRIWPDRLAIRIDEKQVLARWGDSQLLTVAAQLFVPDRGTMPQQLVQLQGPRGLHAKVLESFQRMQQVLVPVKLAIVRLELTEPGAWRVWLSNGVRLELGKKHPFQRLTRFIRVYPRLFVGVPTGSVEYVDLRYSNGMAVRWRDH